MASKQCCGLDAAQDCRCHTEAAQIAEAVRTFVAHRVRRPEDADDVAQEALLRLYRGADSLRDEQALPAWMYRIAEHAIVDHYRRGPPRPGTAGPRSGGAAAAGRRRGARRP